MPIVIAMLILFLLFVGHTINNITMEIVVDRYNFGKKINSSILIASGLLSIVMSVALMLLLYIAMHYQPPILDNVIIVDIEKILITPDKYDKEAVAALNKIANATNSKIVFIGTPETLDNNDFEFEIISSFEYPNNCFSKEEIAALWLKSADLSSIKGIAYIGNANKILSSEIVVVTKDVFNDDLVNKTMEVLKLAKKKDVVVGKVSACKTTSNNKVSFGGQQLQEVIFQ